MCTIVVRGGGGGGAVKEVVKIVNFIRITNAIGICASFSN